MKKWNFKWAQVRSGLGENKLGAHSRSSGGGESQPPGNTCPQISTVSLNRFISICFYIKSRSSPFRKYRLLIKIFSSILPFNFAAYFRQTNNTSFRWKIHKCTLGFFSFSFLSVYSNSLTIPINSQSGLTPTIHHKFSVGFDGGRAHNFLFVCFSLLLLLNCPGNNKH